jgi:hypothetical protein
MLSKNVSYHIGEVRDFLLHDNLWCLAKPSCIVKHELSRIQKLSKCVSKSSLRSFFQKTENVASRIPDREVDLLSRFNVISPTVPGQPATPCIVASSTSNP